MSQHFELKVPGGKLVVVDVDTDGDTITNVKISGDFFIEPDEAFFALSRALEGGVDKRFCGAATSKDGRCSCSIQPC